LNPEDVNKFDSKVLFKESKRSNEVNKGDKRRTGDQSNEFTNESVGNTTLFDEIKKSLNGIGRNLNAHC